MTHEINNLANVVIIAIIRFQNIFILSPLSLIFIIDKIIDNSKKRTVVFNARYSRNILNLLLNLNNLHVCFFSRTGHTIHPTDVHPWLSLTLAATVSH